METILYSQRQAQLDHALLLGEITEEEYYEEMIGEMLVELIVLERLLLDLD